MLAGEVYVCFVELLGGSQVGADSDGTHALFAFLSSFCRCPEHRYDGWRELQHHFVTLATATGSG